MTVEVCDVSSVTSRYASFKQSVDKVSMRPAMLTVKILSLLLSTG